MIPTVEFTFNKLIKNQRPSVKEIEEIVRPNFIANKLELNDSVSSEVVQNFKKKFLQDVETGSLITRQEFIDYGVKILQDIENEIDRNEISLIITHTTVLTDYILENGQQMQLMLGSAKPNIPKNNITGDYEVVKVAQVIAVLKVVLFVAKIIATVDKIAGILIPGYSEWCYDIDLCTYVSKTAGYLSLLYTLYELAE